MCRLDCLCFGLCGSHQCSADTGGLLCIQWIKQHMTWNKMDAISITWLQLCVRHHLILFFVAERKGTWCNLAFEIWCCMHIVSARHTKNSLLQHKVHSGAGPEVLRTEIDQMLFSHFSDGLIDCRVQLFADDVVDDVTADKLIWWYAAMDHCDVPVNDIGRALMQQVLDGVKNAVVVNIIQHQSGCMNHGNGLQDTKSTQRRILKEMPQTSKEIQPLVFLRKGCWNKREGGFQKCWPLSFLT